MSNVSKLAIKACSDNKFSSFTGEFITSINPENLVIKSGIAYHVPHGMIGSSLLKYGGSPPKLLSFSLLFDNTGIIPGSNAIGVMEQVNKLQDIAYNVNKKNNAPNYIRVIWGQIDFKGRLVDLDIVYSMFKVDGTLVRAEASIAVLEEITPLGKGQSTDGKDGDYAQSSGASATSNNDVRDQKSSDDSFAATPDGKNGAYSGAPDGAYDGGPDDTYHGASDANGDKGGSNNQGQKDGSKQEDDKKQTKDGDQKDDKAQTKDGDVKDDKAEKNSGKKEGEQKQANNDKQKSGKGSGAFDSLRGLSNVSMPNLPDFPKMFEGLTWMSLLKKAIEILKK